MTSLCLYCRNSIFIIMNHVAMETVTFYIAHMCLFLDTNIKINTTLLKKGNYPRFGYMSYCCIAIMLYVANI